MIPDKLYIGTVTLSSNVPGEEYLLPDWHLRPNPKIANVEYIRKDALIEWANKQKEEAEFHYNHADMNFVREVVFDDLIDKLNSM